MICHERKFIFVHVPKTGGTSVEKAFFSRIVCGDRETEKRDMLWGWNSQFGWLSHLTCEEMLDSGYVSCDVFKNYLDRKSVV